MNSDPSDNQIELLAWFASNGGKVDHEMFSAQRKSTYKKQAGHYSKESPARFHDKTIWGCEQRGLIYAGTTHYEITEDGMRALGRAMREALHSKKGHITERLLRDVKELSESIARLNKRMGI